MSWMSHVTPAKLADLGLCDAMRTGQPKTADWSQSLSSNDNYCPRLR